MLLVFWSYHAWNLITQLVCASNGNTVYCMAPIEFKNIIIMQAAGNRQCYRCEIFRSLNHDMSHTSPNRRYVLWLVANEDFSSVYILKLSLESDASCGSFVRRHLSKLYATSHIIVSSPLRRYLSLTHSLWDSSNAWHKTSWYAFHLYNVNQHKYLHIWHWFYHYTNQCCWRLGVKKIIQPIKSRVL